MTSTRRRYGMTMLELLIAISVLSLALAPLCYLLSFSTGERGVTQREAFATLLAHHVLEQIVADRIITPTQLPGMSPEEDIVAAADAHHLSSQHFADILPVPPGAVPASAEVRLVRAMQGYRCRVDTYYLDRQMYRVLVYVSFDEGGRRKQVYLERRLGQRPAEILATRSAAVHDGGAPEGREAGHPPPDISVPGSVPVIDGTETPASEPVHAPAGPGSGDSASVDGDAPPRDGPASGCESVAAGEVASADAPAPARDFEAAGSSAASVIDPAVGSMTPGGPP